MKGKTNQCIAFICAEWMFGLNKLHLMLEQHCFKFWPYSLSFKYGLDWTCGDKNITDLAAFSVSLILYLSGFTLSLLVCVLVCVVLGVLKSPFQLKSQCVCSTHTDTSAHYHSALWILMLNNRMLCSHLKILIKLV